MRPEQMMPSPQQPVPIQIDQPKNIEAQELPQPQVTSESDIQV